MRTDHDPAPRDPALPEPDVRPIDEVFRFDARPHADALVDELEAVLRALPPIRLLPGGRDGR